MTPSFLLPPAQSLWQAQRQGWGTAHSRAVRLTPRCAETRPSKRQQPPPPGPPHSTERSEALQGHPSAEPTKAVSLLLLNLVTVLWGTQHAVIKLAVDATHTPPSTLNFLRFLLAALVSAPFLPKLSSFTRGWKSPAVQRGLEQSVWMFLGYAFQSIALQTTTASRSGFLLYLNVKLVPFLALFLYRRHIAPSVWASAGLALLGTGLLTYDGAPPVPGDAWSVAAAAASAMFILRLESATAVAPASQLSAVALCGVAGLSAVWATASAVLSAGGSSVGTQDFLAHVMHGLLPGSASGFVAVAYLGLVTTALSNYLQTLGQRAVSAERAAVVFALDPVYGALFAYLLLGEQLGVQGVFGAALVTAAAVWSNRGVSDSGGSNGPGSVSGAVDGRALGEESCLKGVTPSSEGDGAFAGDKYAAQHRSR